MNNPAFSSGSASGSIRPIPRVLVVDDEPDLRELLELTLVRMGLDVDSAATVGEARECLRRNRYALCLTDMRLPDASGMDLVDAIARDHSGTVVAVITAYGSADNAVAALKAGAFDYLSKPVALDQLRSLVQAALRAAPRGSGSGNEKPVTRTPGDEDERRETTPLLNRLLGESGAIREVRAMIGRVARSQAPVSVSGESGCGKELVARAIHDSSGRRDEAFIAVNCGAIPEHLMEAEFFGYRKGAFTGADADRGGFFHAARGGTLFLDEVAELPLAMQVKLLRVIQERSVRRIGGSSEEEIDVRLISATHQDLSACVAQGRFRHDLYYRLNVIGIHIPPLRERRSDIPLLARHLLKQIEPAVVLTDAAIERLQSHDFLGNVRELNNVLERSVAFAESDGTIDAEDIHFAAIPALPVPVAAVSMALAELSPAALPAELPETVATTPASAGLGLSGTLAEHLDGIERAMIEQALAQTRYNRTAAAELLGITFRQLRYRMQRLNIQ